AIVEQLVSCGNNSTGHAGVVLADVVEGGRIRFVRSGSGLPGNVIRTGQPAAEIGHLAAFAAERAKSVIDPAPATEDAPWTRKHLHILSDPTARLCNADVW